MRLILSIFCALSLSLGGIGLSLATGDIEPKDTLQKDQGPAGMDVPTEKLSKTKIQATPSPSPAPKPKEAEKKKSSY